jgi:hypothetical protein
MLKLFYKTLLVSILSGSLLMLDFSYKGAIVQLNSVQAETLKTGSSKSDNDLMSTLTMTGVGLLTQRLYTCKMTTDMMIAAAGGAAFLAGEVTSFLSQKNAQKELETQIERDKNGNPTQQQIEILKKLKESYEAARKTANMKKMFQMAAAAAFAAAAIAAYMEEAKEQAVFKACDAAAKAAGQACTELQEAAQAQSALVQTLQSTRMIPKPSAAGEAASTATQGELVTAAMSAVSQGASYTAASAPICDDPYTTNPYNCKEQANCAPSGESMSTACQPIMPTLKTTEGFCPAPITLGQNSSGSSRQLYAGMNGRLNIVFLNVLGKMLMPEAKADLFSPLGIASSLAISYLLMTSKTLGATIDSYLLAPINRAIIWGILGGLAYAASSATDSQISQINSDIQKIDAILNSMNTLSNGVAVEQTPSVQNPKIEKTLVPEVKVGVNNYQTPAPVDFSAAGGKLPCMTGDKSCPAFSTQFNALAAPGSTPGLTQAQLGALTTMADGVNGTSSISSGTIKSAETLASQAVALRSEMEKQKKKAQDNLKASGSKQDLSKAESDLDRMMREAMEKELKSRNMSAGAMLASMGSGFGSGSGSGSASAAVATDANKNAKATAAKKPVIAPVGVVDMSSSLNGSNKGFNNGLTLDANKKDDATLTADAAKAGAAGATMDDYVLKNDITQDKDSSLFDLISNRYQKSGYPRLFKKIK